MKNQRLIAAFLVNGVSGSALKPIILSHGWVYLEPALKDEEGKRLRYSFSVKQKQPITIEIYQAKGRMFIGRDSVLPEGLSKEFKNVVHRILSLDFKKNKFMHLCQVNKASHILPLAKRGWGRMFRSATAWEDAAKTLCTTNASWSYTQQMCYRFCQELGRKTKSGFRTFPSPDDVIKAGEPFLKNVIKMGYRSRSMMELARRAMIVPWLLDIRIIPSEAEALSEIKSWNGFGQYATNHMMMLLGFHKYLPVDREVLNYLGVKQTKRHKVPTIDRYDKWGDFKFTAYKLERVAKRLNWIGD